MAKAKKTPKTSFSLKQNILPIILALILFLLINIVYQLFLTNKYYPVTKVGDINISFLTREQAIRTIQAKFQKRIQQKIILSYPQGNFTIDLATSSASLDFSEVNYAFTNNHSGNTWELLKKELQTLILPTLITPKINLSLDKQLNNIESAVYQPPKNAELIFDEAPAQDSSASARIQIKESQTGLVLDKEQIQKQIIAFLLTGKHPTTLPLKAIPPKITDSYVLKAKNVLENSLSEPLNLTFDNISWVLDTKQLLALLDLQTGQNLLDKDKTYLYLGKIASEIDQEVQEGLFEFNPNTHRVSAFKPSREGRKVNQDQAYQLLTETLVSSSSKTIHLPVDIIKPKIATSDINSLGIKELLGKGVSNFAGSIANRIYNVGLTASKINGVLIPPGEVFSFNQTVGDISAATGFKQAYVIKEGRTVLDDGGGVCQDSTTLFRAVLNAGLPVVKRTAHAYRVGYYEQGFPPGLDATVFYPSVDFQFRNDTPAHILIQAYTNGTTLYIDLYGTPDGREVVLTKPVITNQTPPPPELRQDDPSLPKGTIKQVDWAAWGATVTFKRTVTKGGKALIDETWRSNYKPWQAVYLIGTQ